MAVQRIISRLEDFFSGLYYRQWERWELIAIAIVAAVILLMIVRARLKVSADERRLRERSPIIGVRIARYGRRH